MCARLLTPNPSLALGRGEPKPGDLVAAADIGAVAGPFTRAGTVIDDRVGDKRIGSGRATNLSVTLLHPWSVGQDGADLNPATGWEADRAQRLHFGSCGAIIKIDLKRIAVGIGFAGVHDG